MSTADVNTKVLITRIAEDYKEMIADFMVRWPELKELEGRFDCRFYMYTADFGSTVVNQRYDGSGLVTDSLNVNAIKNMPANFLIKFQERVD